MLNHVGQSRGQCLGCLRVGERDDDRFDGILTGRFLFRDLAEEVSST
ncbi:hypothetical protein FDG2_4170 [Candidatus Protofrankia californiensis]|uniref:Uncharacterized protein n=1 Tax=Candidatus Protofrankia californiensis TaxID=1839754 RepID=A0A1C3P3T5_9ACTN|nr:hypothetical protein FDG2_4170 [Candidatus Protofrankia californiensis]